jgi:DNA-directed RNA polymerase III subunit RPC6
VKDIEMILDTLIFDGKLEMTVVHDTSATETSRFDEYRKKKLYRAVKPILSSTGLVRVPCGVCPVRFELGINHS